jgi:hypothetical protein
MDMKVVTIPVDQNFQAEMEKLQAEGWVSMPGVAPQAVYFLVRQPQQPAGAAFGTMGVDDAKVHIIKGENGNG